MKRLFDEDDDSDSDDDIDEAYQIGKRYITYDVLRFGWSRSNS
mgnify:CR=1 FL=1